MNPAVLSRPTDHVQRTISSYTPTDAADAITGVEEVHHPVSLFTDPSYAELPLRQLAQAFDTWQEGRTKPIKDCSRKKYRYSLDKLLTFMERQQIPTELSY